MVVVQKSKGGCRVQYEGRISLPAPLLTFLSFAQSTIVDSRYLIPSPPVWARLISPEIYARLIIAAANRFAKIEEPRPRSFAGVVETSHGRNTGVLCPLEGLSLHPAYVSAHFIAGANRPPKGRIILLP